MEVVLDIAQSADKLGVIDESITNTRFISSLCDHMLVAEGMIDWAIRQYPDKAKWLYGSFMTLTPTFLSYEKLYRLHCREILIRIGKNQDIHNPTDAEIIRSLIAAAGQNLSTAKVGRDKGFAMFNMLMRQYFPELTFVEDIRRYETEVDELYQHYKSQQITRHMPYERPIPESRWREIYPSRKRRLFD